MELRKFEHCLKQDYKAAAAARKICEAEREDVVTERVAQRCFQSFDTGEENKDLPLSGRPKLWENIRRVSEENLHKSTRRLSEELGASEYTTHHHIKAL